MKLYWIDCDLYEWILAEQIAAETIGGHRTGWIKLIVLSKAGLAVRWMHEACLEVR